MGDDILTEDEMIAHAIALSLQAESGNEAEGGSVRIDPAQTMTSEAVKQPSPNTSTPDVESDPPLIRSDTTQSNDSLLSVPINDSLTGNSTQASQHSLRSSPDLGIAAESDVDPMSGATGRNDGKKDSQDSLRSSPEMFTDVQPLNMQNITLDGKATCSTNWTNPIGMVGGSHQLPFTRLSSLHDFNLETGAGEGQASASKGWSPNKDSLELIVGMGISENAAKRALYHTGNDNAELAVGWVFENIGDPDLHEPFKPPMMISMPVSGNSSVGGPVYLSFDDLIQASPDFNKEDSYKMILVVNTELKMRVGKVAAQVGHAVLGLYQYIESQQDHKQELREWENQGAKKVTLRGNSTEHLLALKQKAVNLNITNIMVHDAGRTQVEPGSLTVLALFGRSKNVDPVTGYLKLL